MKPTVGCPWCGHGDMLEVFAGNVRGHIGGFVMCHNCGATGPLSAKGTYKEAVARWDHRAQFPRLTPRAPDDPLSPVRDPRTVDRRRKIDPSSANDYLPLAVQHAVGLSLWAWMTTLPEPTMAYCRIGEQGSDVYLWRGDRLYCSGCLLNYGGETVISNRLSALKHLERHRDAGHTVPEAAFSRLRGEINAEDGDEEMIG